MAATGHMCSLHSLHRQKTKSSPLAALTIPVLSSRLQLLWGAVQVPGRHVASKLHTNVCLETSTSLYKRKSLEKSTRRTYHWS